MISFNFILKYNLIILIYKYICFFILFFKTIYNYKKEL